MTGLTAAAERLTTGSVILGRRLGARLTTWVHRGRRTDLTGWQAALGPIARSAVLLVLGYVAVRIVRARPIVLWPLVVAWLVAVFRVTRTESAPVPVEVSEPQPEPAEQTPIDPRAGLARWLLQTIGERPGIHLRELYPAMRQLPGQEERDDTALRALLVTLGITPVRSLRVGGVAGRSGVRRDDVQALLPRAETTTGERYGDAGQRQDSPPLSTVGERVKSA